MNKFCFSQTYTFDAPAGQRKHYFFNLVERHGKSVLFRLNDNGNEDVIDASMVVNGDIETATFHYKGQEFSLSADRFIPKGYALSPEGQSAKKDDRLKDAHLHTVENCDEIELSQSVGCICCEHIFPADEVEDYIDLGATALCPYCGCDSIIADAFGIELTEELLAELKEKYF